MLREKCDLWAFVGDLGPELAWDARQGCEQHGRGVLVVGFDPAGSGRFAGRYVPLGEAVELGFSDDVTDAAREYDVEREAVLFVEVGETYRLLKISLEGGPAHGARPN